MEYLSWCILFFTLLFEFSICVDELKPENGNKKNEIDENSPSEPIRTPEKGIEESSSGENLENRGIYTELGGTSDSTADADSSVRSVDDVLKKSEVDKSTSAKSDEFTEIEIDEKPPEKNGEEQNQVGPSQPTTSKKHLADIRALVMAEKYCESIYNPEDVEILLHLDDLVPNRPGGNWWKVGALFLGEGGANMSRPMCSTYPRLRVFLMSTKISEHEFFRSRKIDIPMRIGKQGFRFVEFRYINRVTTDRVVLECPCQIQEGATDVNKQENICLGGRLVTLSKGVGGNQSFFVYALNPASRHFNVVAHICFP